MVTPKPAGFFGMPIAVFFPEAGSKSRTTATADLDEHDLEVLCARFRRVAAFMKESLIMLRIEILKNPDGTGVLRCTRQDGSVTWQKQMNHAPYFALHDLTHYAVESTLGYRHGFFGLIASGWDIEDTTGRGVRGVLPSEALEVERIVGLFQSEQISSTLWTTEQFNTFAPRPLTDAEIRNVRRLRGTLFERWFAIPLGDKLELQFEAGVIMTA